MNPRSAPRFGITTSLHAWALAVGVALAAGWLTHAGRVRVPFDSYFYIEFAKQFRGSAPGSFGSAWPYGWPLLGAATGLAGLSAYHGLLLLAAAAWAGLLAIVAKISPWAHPETVPGTFWLLALGTTAAALQFVAAVFSEVPFALALLGFALALARGPNRAAIVAACGLALAAFSIRYIGALCFLLLAGHLWLLYRRGAATRGAMLAVASTLATGCALLLWNRIATGHWSGQPRGASEPVGAWLGIAADFGWSLPTLVIGLRGRELLGFGSAAGTVVGLVSLGAIVVLAWRGVRDQRPLHAALGAVVLAYSLAMIALRCIGQFDALHNARTALPILAPLLILTAPLLRHRAFVVVPLGWLALNAAFLTRGPNLAASADVSAAMPALRGLGATEFVSANDEARTLAALLRQRVRRIESTEDAARVDHGSAVILAAAPDGPGAGTLADSWREFARDLLQSGNYRLAHDTPSMIVLLRKT